MINIVIQAFRLFLEFCPDDFERVLESWLCHNLDLLDFIILEESGLYEETDQGKLKVDAAANRLRKQNSHVRIEVYPEQLSWENYNRAFEIIAGYDIVVDACDNMATRYLVSDITEELSIPYVYGAMEGFCGYVSVFNDASSFRRFRDLWPEEGQELPRDIPAMGVTAGVIGCLQANEVIKRICGFGERLTGKLLTVDLCHLTFHLISI